MVMLSPSLPPVDYNADFSLPRNIRKFLKSSSRPLLSSACGYSQSMSTPSKLYVDMNEIRDFIKAAWLASDLAKSLNVVALF